MIIKATTIVISIAIRRFVKLIYMNCNPSNIKGLMTIEKNIIRKIISGIVPRSTKTAFFFHL